MVGSLGMRGNIRYRGINEINFKYQLKLRCLNYVEMLSLSTLYRIFGFLWGQTSKM